MSARKPSEEPTRLSLVVAAISGALIAILVGYLVLLAVRTGAPPIIDVEVATAEARVQGTNGYVPVDIRNAGDGSAAEVEIEIRFGAGPEAVVERARVDYLAGGESRRVWVIGPAGAAVAARVVGYQEP